MLFNFMLRKLISPCANKTKKVFNIKTSSTQKTIIQNENNLVSVFLSVIQKLFCFVRANFNKCICKKKKMGQKDFFLP